MIDSLIELEEFHNFLDCGFYMQRLKQQDANVQLTLHLVRANNAARLNKQNIGRLKPCVSDQTGNRDKLMMISPITGQCSCYTRHKWTVKTTVRKFQRVTTNYTHCNWNWQGSDLDEMPWVEIQVNSYGWGVFLILTS